MKLTILIGDLDENKISYIIADHLTYTFMALVLKKVSGFLLAELARP